MIILDQITWKTWKPQPGEFRCVLCQTNDATHIMHLAGFEVPVCLECGQTDEGELIARLTRPERGE